MSKIQLEPTLSFWELYNSNSLAVSIKTSSESFEMEGRLFITFNISAT